jgi:hypothetical protein
MENFNTDSHGFSHQKLDAISLQNSSGLARDFSNSE